MSDSKVLERKVFHSGKPLITAGESKSEAYIIQDGEVVSYENKEGKRVEIERYGAGVIIGEAFLITDYRSPVTYEALTSTTVVIITRQEFEKKLKKTDPVVTKVLNHTVNKLQGYEMRWNEYMSQSRENNFKAMEIVDHLLKNMDRPRRLKYQEILLPQFNIMVKALENIRKEEREIKAAKKLKELKEKGAQTAEEI